MIFFYLDMSPDKLCDLRWKAKILEKLLPHFVMISWKDDSKSFENVSSPVTCPKSGPITTHSLQAIFQTHKVSFRISTSH